MNREEIERLINEKIEEWGRSFKLGQHNIPPQVIKERHVDWEAFGLTIANSSKKAISSSIGTSSIYSTSTDLGDGEDFWTLRYIYYTYYPDTTILVVWHANFFEGSVDNANHIPSGVDVTSSDYRWYFSPREHALSKTGKDQFETWMINQSGGDKTIIYRVVCRYIGFPAT